MNTPWPVAEIDPVARLHILAAALPGAVVVEGVIGTEPDRLWSVAADLERTVPAIQPHVRSLRIADRGDDRLTADVRGHLGLRARMNIVLRPRWCWMQSRFLVVGMAAVPHPDGTRFGRLQALRFPAPVRRALPPAAVRLALKAELRRLDELSRS
ncbi:hypothetical protein [Phytoactinopolyspora mesophila]|uniref:SRPBCC family protein n=1 Tax=Phytoactinopolyspora mesophila TaxID=2650750 RepID=A0A7K3M393_9ACTN|nr:hypothetical protein [Phytoactinopolyspora mesophila]NDL56918.1 hypothetical protein [Phytoactinopolyspora mesophila]